MSRVPAEAIKEQANAIFNQIGTAAMHDTTKMYQTESFIWSLSYVKDWIDTRYDSIRVQISDQRALSTTAQAVTVRSRRTLRTNRGDASSTSRIKPLGSASRAPR
jgi:hypothetical protein